MTKEFERETRYLVIKHKDAEQALTSDEITTLSKLADKVALWRDWNGKIPLEAIVVESDWPEYEPVWAMIEARMAGDKP